MFNSIKLNDTGSSVQILRTIFGLSSDGSFDPGVQQRVILFQKNAGLRVDGVVGSDTWTALSKSMTTLRKGTTHTHVKVLQMILGGLTVDGKFGAKTSTHVVGYQKAAQLTADGVVGPKTWASLFQASVQSAEPVIVSNPVISSSIQSPSFTKPTDFKQGDSRWGKNMYSSTGNKNQTMANSGCGPTASANIINYMKDKTVTPWTLAQLSLKWGCRTASSGTAWSFFKKVAEHFKCSSFQQTTSLATVLAALDNGALVVCSMAPPFWTKGGHFITLWKYDSATMYANDPASSSRKSQNQKDFHKQCKQYFIFYK